MTYQQVFFYILVILKQITNVIEPFEMLWIIWFSFNLITVKFTLKFGKFLSNFCLKFFFRFSEYKSIKRKYQLNNL